MKMSKQKRKETIPAILKAIQILNQDIDELNETYKNTHHLPTAWGRKFDLLIKFTNLRTSQLSFVGVKSKRRYQRVLHESEWISRVTGAPAGEIAERFLFLLRGFINYH